MSSSDLFGSDAVAAVLDSSASPLLAISPDDRICYANPAALAELGYPVEELVGQEVSLLYPPDQVDELAELRADWAEPLPRPHGEGRNLRVRRKDGSTFPVEVSVTPVATSLGTIGLLGLVDITARLHTEHDTVNLARAHLAMADLNDAVVRSTDADELLDAGVAAFGRVDQHGAVTLVRGRQSHATRVEGALARAGDPTTPYVGPDEDGSGRVAVLPVLRGGEVTARVVLWSPGSLLDDPSVRAVLTTMAANLSGGLDRIVQRDRLQRADAQRLDLFRRLLDAQDEERRRIAADVHDDSIQALAALQLHVGLLAHRLAGEGQDVVESCNHIQAEVARVMAGLRTLLFELEPVSTATALVDVVSEVLDGGLVDAAEVRPVEVDWSAYGPDERDPSAVDLPPELRGQAARILKEALRNVARHARASWVRVVLRPDPDGVEIAVVDDGLGFPTGSGVIASAPGHRGVAGMLDRAALCGGWCRLERDGGLTTLRFWLPRSGLATDPFGAGE